MLPLCSFLENSSNRKNCSVICRRSKFNSVSCIACMYNCVIAHINSNMSTVTYDISRLHLGNAHFTSSASLCGRTVWQSYTKMCIYGHNKTGTIGSVCQARTTVYIRISNKLTCVTCNCRSCRGSACAAGTATACTSRRTT